MLKSFKVITIAFALYMLLCIPALAAQVVGGFVSNTPIPAGPDASIGEVWMRHGGARLQYDALMGSIQTNTNGRMRRDPAAITSLPPLYPQKRVVRKVKKATTASPKVKKTPMQAKPNPSPKPILPQKTTETTKIPTTSNVEVSPTQNTSANAPSIYSETPINPIPNSNNSTVQSANINTSNIQ